MLTNWIYNLNERGRVALFVGFVAVLICAALWAWSSDPEDSEPTGSEDSGEITTTPATTIPPTTTTEDPEVDTETPVAVPTELDLDVTLPLTEAQLTRLAQSAADFTVAFQSFRYDQDSASRLAAVRPLLASRHMIDLSSLSPNAAQQTMMRDAKARVIVTPSRAEVDLVSAETVSTQVTVAIKTTIDGETSVTEQTFAVTMVRDGSAWGVQDFTVPGRD